MATVTKRGDSYRIKVSCGYDVNGKQVVQTKIWKPEPDMTARQIKKELDRQCVMFEEECKKGQVVATIKFENFAEQWFEEYAKINLRNTSFERMKPLTARVYPAIGHLRLDKITGRHIQQFINDLINSTSERTGRPLAEKDSHSSSELHFRCIQLCGQDGYAHLQSLPKGHSTQGRGKGKGYLHD